MPASDAPKDTEGFLRASAAKPAPVAPPRRARPIYRVFVSSTWTDLQPERRALMEALNRMEEMRFVGMEFFGNRPDDTHDASIDQVDLCEVLVGIIGHRYGSGITEAEYRRARELGLPCFVYFKREAEMRPDLTDNDPALAAKLATFKQDLLRGHTVKEFASPEELAANATADLHNWVAARWISLESDPRIDSRSPVALPDADRTNVLRLLERIQHDWIEGVLEASLHHRAWIDLGLDWRNDAVEHPWDRIVVAPNRPIQTLAAEDSIASVFDGAQNTLLVLGEPGAGKTTTLLELARDLIARARGAPVEPVPVVLALSTWTDAQRDFSAWLITELGLRYQVPKRLAQSWLDEGRFVLLLDGLDEVTEGQRAACVGAVNAFAEAHPPSGLAVTCRVAEYEALPVKLRLRTAICLQPLTPEQIERYFAAAGPGLDSLRLALRDDATLRELARTPLMLSVMTMAWQDAPAEEVQRVAGDTPEARRRQLFDAYVQAALHRRGKATGGYAPLQTNRWLTWLAERMKAHDQTLFAVEQLQPGWLAGAASQFGYFMATRIFATVGLGLPLLLWKTSLANRLACLALSLALGLIYGTVDYLFLRRGSRGSDLGSRRFWTMLLVTIGTGIAWAWLDLALTPRHAPVEPAVGYGLSYLMMAAFAFCAPVDVRSLDIKPSDTMRWSWRLAVERLWVAVVGLNLLLFVVFTATLVALVYDRGWRSATTGLGGIGFIAGVVVGAAAGIFVCSRIWTKGRVLAVAAMLACVSIGGQIGVLAGHWDSSGFLGMVMEFSFAGFIGVYGGFVSGMIDPSRARRSGIWFWLRVPLLAFLVVGLLTTIPVGGWIISTSVQRHQPVPWNILSSMLAIGASIGLVAFFRFGGFNGLQHLFLRRLLVRSGHLPPRAEKFFDHAAQLALLQKVGFGYRFIHALLLDHLADQEVKPRG